MRGRKARKELSEAPGTKAIQGATLPLAGDKEANSPQKDQILSDQAEALVAKSDSPNVVGTKRDLQLPQYFGRLLHSPPELL